MKPASSSLPETFSTERSQKRLRTGQKDAFEVVQSINMQIDAFEKNQKERDDKVEASVEKLRQEWMAGNHISSCCKKKCWSHFSLENVASEREKQLSSGNHRQRSFYLSRCIKACMTQSLSGFVILGHPVCTSFFRFVHGISNKKLFKIKEDFINSTRCHGMISSAERNKDSSKRKENVANVISFILRLAVYGDKYPTSADVYLYCLSRAEVYAL